MASKRERLELQLQALEAGKRRTIEKFDELIARHQTELQLLSEAEGNADAGELPPFEIPPPQL